jgi:enediyne biosynthesis protein E4
MVNLSGRAAVASLASLIALGCSSSSSNRSAPSGGPGTVVHETNYTLTVLAHASAGTCNVHAEQPSQFTDETAKWGLSNVAMNGFYSADLDHDGYPDLILLSGTQDERGTVGSSTPDVMVLMNRPAPDGGRTFVDETKASGLFKTRGGAKNEYRMTQLVTFGDVNNDGNLDVFTGINYDPNNTNTTAPFNQDRSEILLNDGTGHFTLAAQSDPSADVETDNNQAVFTDVDNDGKLDLLLTYWFKDGIQGVPIGSQVQLFHGNGDGTFRSVTQAAGLIMDNTGSLSSIVGGENSRPLFGTVACDLNGDGYPELLLSSYGGESNVLYENDGTGKFQRVIQKGGFDGDTIVDYHDNQYYRCYCTAHASDTYCAGATAPNIQCPQPVNSYWEPGFSDSPAMANGNNFSAACGDVDGDGKPDVFQGTIRHWWAGNATDPPTLLLNKTHAGGSINLQRVDGAKNGVVFPHIDPLGWNEGIQQVSLVDMDNDGRTDILLGGSDYAYQYGHLFIQQPDGTFQDLAQEWGLRFPCMDGLAVADFDRDGDLDVVVRGSLFRDCAAPGWAALPGKDPGFAGYKTPEVHIFINNASEHSHWLELRLVAEDGVTNKMGMGARVTVTANGVAQTRAMLGAHGIGSESDDPGVLFFGLGACPAVDKIEVYWPNQAQSTDTWSDVPADHFLELHQGDPALYAVNLKQPASKSAAP